MGIEYKELTVEALRENRKDLVELLMGTDKTSQLAKQVETLTESLKSKDGELATFKAKEAEATKALAIVTELKESKLDTNDAKVCSPVFMASLQNAPDAETRKALIEDRKGVMSALRESHRAAPPFGVVASPTEGYKAPQSKAELLGRL